jgi:hypothetical protein
MEVSDSIQSILDDYLAGHPTVSALSTRADVVLALLRVNTEETLRCAEELTGLTITKCPDYIPPWPPKPISKLPREATLTFVDPEKTYLREMGDRYKQIKVGMTRDQVKARGVTSRDISYWEKKESIKWGKLDD